MDEASLEEFKQIFERFTKVADEASGAAADAAEAEAEAAAAATAAAAAASKGKAKKSGEGGDESDSDEDGEGAGPRLSRKARKLKSRLSVAELKQLVQRPDVVEAHDVTAADPRMLVFLKVRDRVGREREREHGGGLSTARRRMLTYKPIVFFSTVAVKLFLQDAGNKVERIKQTVWKRTPSTAQQPRPSIARSYERRLTKTRCLGNGFSLMLSEKCLTYK